jgi:uncharacterized protein YbgA (DUF1722 family)
MRPRIGISDRLLGEDGRSSRHLFLAEALGAHVDWVPYTAEMEMTLGALWETWRLTGQNGLLANGHAALSPLPTPDGLDGYLAQAGLDEATAFGVRDVFARRIRASYPLLPVAEEDVLDAAEPRTRFVERVFAAARLRELFSGDWRTRDLVDFHTRHKLQILAHDPARYRQIGPIVAAAGRRPRADTEQDYRRIFGEALASVATRGRNANALQHAFGRVGEHLDGRQRQAMHDRISAYQRGELPFGIPVVLLTGHAVGADLDWVAQQTYLNPFPRDLRRHLWTLDTEAPLALS